MEKKHGRNDNILWERKENLALIIQPLDALSFKRKLLNITPVIHTNVKKI